MPVTENDFRNAMKRWTTGVTIVTSRDGEHRVGMTVSSFTSVSVDPPVVCVSINHYSQAYAIIDHSEVFAVTVLQKKQEAISECFAGRIPDDGDRFYGIDTFTLETGAPLISDGIAFFDCKVTKKVTFGSNTVYFGLVLAVKHVDDNDPLLYTNRTYQSLQK